MIDEGSTVAASLEAPVVTLHQDLASLAGLRGRWESLAAQRGTSAAQTYEYVVAAWEFVASRPGAQLAVISVEEGDELLALWPLFVERVGGVRIGRHLGCGGDEEYGGPLVVADPRAPAAVAQAFDRARALVDVLKIYNVRPENIAAPVLNDIPLLKYSGFVLSPIVRSSAASNWDSWFQSRSKSFRAGLRYDRKRISQIGEPRLEKIEDPERLLQMVDWIFERKKASAISQGNLGSWVLSEHGAPFFKRVATSSDRVNVYALMVGDVIAAAAILLESIDLVEYYTTSYNHEFSIYSPGNLLIEELIRYSIARNKDFDFRITKESYKMRWVDGAQRYNSYIIATSLRGINPVLSHIRRRSIIAIKNRIRAKLATLRHQSKRRAA